MEEIKEFDCFGDGCGKCEVCEYLSFREMAEGCAPGGSTIERNEKIERYLKRKDEEINLAVSKERERRDAQIIEFINSGEPAPWNDTGWSVELSDVEKFIKNTK